MPTTSRRRRLAVLAVVLAAYALGVATVRYRLFPYDALERVAAWVGGLFGGAQDRHGAGLWHRLPPGDGSATSPSEHTLEELAQTPYRRGFKAAPQVDSVTVHDPRAAHDGLNLVLSGHAPRAVLQDMRGNTLHEWHRAFADVPGFVGFAEHPLHQTHWRRAHVFPNGDLLAIFDGIGILKLDRDSNLIWANNGNAHHDVFVAADGTIYTLTRRERVQHQRLRRKGPVLEDFISVLAPDGVERRRVSILQSFLDSDYASWLPLAPDVFDVFHTNSIEIMDGRFAARHPLFARGNALISVPTLNAIAVVDLEQQKVVWALGGLWMFQHEPTVLDNGNLLVFDNLGNHGGSKVVEIDPLTQDIAWRYGDGPRQRFSSFMLGSCQRLANGNTLITESTAGRAFEVTRAGEIVWEYVNPARAGDHNELVASLLEVVRLDRDYFTADFTAAQNEYASGKRQLDLTELERLRDRLR